MIHKLFFTLSLWASIQVTTTYAQSHAALPMHQYRVTETKINDLIHTKLDVKFDYAKRYLYGQEWVTLKPHFYPTDSLRLDAKEWILKKFLYCMISKKQP